MRFRYLLGLIVWLLITWLLTPWLPGPTPAGAAPPPLPAGLTWTIRPPGTDAVVLHRVDAAGTVTRQPLDHSLNAIACAADGTIFALADRRAGVTLPGGPHLVRVSRTPPSSSATGTGQGAGSAGGAGAGAAGAVGQGEVVDLGVVDPAGTTYPLAQGYAATMHAGALLIASGGVLRRVRVNGGAPAVIASRPLPDLPLVGDWAADPGTGDLYTVVAENGGAQLVRLAAADLAPTRTPLPGLPAGSGYGAVALAGRTLYALYHRADRPGAIYRIPLDRPNAVQQVSTVDRAESSDATYCPPPAPPPAPAQPAPPAAPAPPRALTPPPPPVPVAVPPPPRSTQAPPTPAPTPRRTRTPRAEPRPAAASLVTTRFIPFAAGAMVLGFSAIRIVRRHPTRRR